MLKRILIALFSLLLVFGSVYVPNATVRAQDNPGACEKLPAPTTAATSAATTEATAAAATPEITTEPAGITPGSLALSGAFALYPLAQKWGEEYNILHSDVQFDIQAGGAGKGITDVLGGAVNIAMVSRDLRQEEKDKGAVGVPVAIDAVVFTINAQNPVIEQIKAKGLPCSALAKIFLSGEQLTWGQLVGTDDQSVVNVYTRADSAGAAEQAAKYLGASVQDDLQGTGVQGDPGVLGAVLQDPLGIGFNNIGFAYDPESKNPIEGIAIVPLDQNGNGSLDAEEAIYATQKDITTAIATDKYPSPPARELFLVTKGAPTGTALEFLRWVLTDGQAFVEEAGYVKLKDDVIKSALDSLK
jgi:phosphate transport system substrate-binding protein